MNALHYSDELSKLSGQAIKVQKGLPRKGLSKDDRGVILSAVYVREMGFRVHFKVHGTERIMWATNIARLRGDTLSLNTGDPTQRVVLAKV